MINAGTRVYHVDENGEVVSALAVTGEDGSSVTLQLPNHHNVTVSIWSVFNSPVAANIAANARKTDNVTKMMKARKAGGPTFIKG